MQLLPRRWSAALRRWTPKSLYGRALLGVVLPIALMQLAVTWGFFEAHWRSTTGRLSNGLAGEIAWVVDRVGPAPTPQMVAAVAREAATMRLEVSYQPGARLPDDRRRPLIREGEKTLKDALNARLPAKSWFESTTLPGRVDIRVQRPGGVLRVTAPRARAFVRQPLIFLVWMTGATVVLTAVAVYAIRGQVRAMVRLADAADAFGRGLDTGPFKPQGAREVRQAGQAFNAMKARIQRHIAQRTTLLAGVSHDLRTPLTRLKLELAMAEPSGQVEAMRQDLADMERMIDDYLAFARGAHDDAAEPPAPIDLRTLLETVAADVRAAGAEARVEAPADAVATVRPAPTRRALQNLAQNAAAHGRLVVLAAAVEPGAVTLSVDDDGPGIPAERRAEALRPFSRLDESRNQNRKGVGLGLAIARDLARAQGGELLLEDSALGGLRAVLRLPT